MEYLKTPIGELQIPDNDRVEFCPNLVGIILILVLTFKGWAVLLEILKNSHINGNVAVMIFLVSAMLIPAFIWYGIEGLFKLLILWLKKLNGE